MGKFGSNFFNKLSEGYNTLKANHEEAIRQKIRTSFCVPEDEKVLSSHVRMPLGVISDGVVVTTRALYLHAKHKDEQGCTWIPYGEICEYLAVQTDPKASVRLYRSDGSIREILEKSLVDVKAGPELLQSIRNVQRQLIDRAPQFSAQHDSVIRRVLADSRQAMTYTGLSAERISLLSYLLTAPAHGKDAAWLLAEDHAKSHTKNAYNAYIQTICAGTNAAWQSELLAARPRFISNFCQRLQDLGQEIDQAWAERLWKELSVATSADFPDLALGLIAARALKFDGAEQRAASLDAGGAPSDAKKLRLFSCLYRNKLMKKVWEQLQAGEEIDKAYLQLSDGLGLTALHYAMILGDKTAVENLLPRRKWLTPTSYPPLVASGLDYINLAMLLGDETLAERLVEETPTAKKMMRRILLLRYGVQAGKVGLQIVAAVATANAANHDYDEERDVWYSEVGEGYEEMDSFFEEEAQAREQCMEAVQNAYFLREKLSDAQSESEQKMIEDYFVYCDTCLETAAATAASWRTTQDPLIAYLVKLYTSPDFLYKILSSEPSDFQLFQCESYYFIAPPYNEEELHLPNDEAAKWGADIEKAYGTSWFSPAAHSDINTLRKEFRSLAKKYHPDVSEIPNCTVIIQDISNEYSDLMLSFQVT